MNVDDDGPQDFIKGTNTMLEFKPLVMSEVKKDDSIPVDVSEQSIIVTN